MKRLFHLALIFGLSAPIAHAEEKYIPPEKAGWILRTTAPETIAKYRKFRELQNWCAYEERQEHPDPQICKLAQNYYKTAIVPTRADVAMINTGIAELKAAPSTPIVDAHIRSLEAAIEEIKYNLRPTDAE